MDGGEEGAVEPSAALGDEFGDLLGISQGERWQYGRKGETHLVRHVSNGVCGFHIMQDP